MSDPSEMEPAEGARETVADEGAEPGAETTREQGTGEQANARTDEDDDEAGGD